MNLNDIYEVNSEGKDGYQDVSQDNSQPQLGDLRKTKLTLRQINKLRRLNDVRAYEFKEKIDRVKKQYGSPAEPQM